MWFVLLRVIWGILPSAGWCWMFFKIEHLAFEIALFAAFCCVDDFELKIIFLISRCIGLAGCLTGAHTVFLLFLASER